MQRKDNAQPKLCVREEAHSHAAQCGKTLSAGSEEKKEMLLIKNGRVLTMAQGSVPDHAADRARADSLFGEPLDILCRDGKIERIAPDISLPESAEVQVLDASGCLVTPGLIDAHCHVGITEEKKGIEGDDCNENVEPVTPWLRAVDAINTMDAAFDDADLIVRAPAAMKIAFGENPKVNYAGMGKSPVTRMAIAGMLRRELFSARQYCQQRQQGETEEDFCLEPWMPVFARQIPLKAHVHRVDDIFTAIRIAEEFGLRMTLDHCSEGHLIADEIAASGFPAIVGPDLSSRNKIEIQNVDFKTSGVLYRAGVQVAICTDHPVSTIQSLPLCAGLAVKEGLPMYAGLEAITCNPARICGVYDRVGSLEEGKDADIAVFTSNPMEIFSQTLFTIINGEIVYQRKDGSDSHRST